MPARIGAPGPRTSAGTSTRGGKEDHSTRRQRRHHAADTTRQKARSTSVPQHSCRSPALFAKRTTQPERNRLMTTRSRKSPCYRTIGGRWRRCLLAVFWPGASGPSWQKHWSRPLEITNRGVLAGLGGHDGHSTARASGCRRRANQRGAPSTPPGAHPARCRSAAPAAAQRPPQPWVRGWAGRGVNIRMCGRSR
jgi:hypothetical protein